MQNKKDAWKGEGHPFFETFGYFMRFLEMK